MAKKMNVLKKIFLFILLLYPLGELTKLQLCCGISFTINDIAVVVLLLSLIVIKRSKLFDILKNSIFKPLIVFLGVSILSLLVNLGNYPFNQIAVGALYLVRFAAYASLLFLTPLFDFGFKQKIKKVLFIIGGIFAVLGYLQYFLYPNLRNLYYLGWDEHMFRLFSSFLDPNFAGAFLTLYLFFVFFTFRDAFHKSNNTVKVLMASYCIAIFFAIILTFSRGTFVMASVMTISSLIIYKQKRMIFLFVLSAVVIFIILSRNFSIENMNLLRTASISPRIETMRNAITIFINYPIFGMGFNTYRYAQYKYGFITGEKWETSHAGAGVDNSFLFVLATTGIVGFLTFMNFWRTILIRTFILFKKDTAKQRMHVIAFISIIGLFTHALFMNSMFYPFLMEWIFIIVGLSVKENT